MKWTLWSSATGSHGARWLIRLVALDDEGTQFLNPPTPTKKKKKELMHSRISCLNYNLHISSLPMPSTIIRLRLCIWSAMQIDNYMAQFCKYLRKETCEKVLKINWLKILSWAKAQLLAWKFKWLERQRDRIGINEVAMLLLHVPPFKLQVLSAFYYLHSINTTIIIIDMNGLQMIICIQKLILISLY